MAKAARGLGKGLDSLIPVATPKTETKAEEIKEDNGQGTYVKITKVEPNREQPRKNFDEDALQGWRIPLSSMESWSPLLCRIERLTMRS